VFQWFAAMATYLPTDDVAAFLHPMVSTLHRTAKDDTARGKDAGRSFSGLPVP
jgi:hypothetical protein